MRRAIFNRGENTVGCFAPLGHVFGVWGENLYLAATAAAILPATPGIPRTPPPLAASCRGPTICHRCGSGFCRCREQLGGLEVFRKNTQSYFSPALCTNGVSIDLPLKTPKNFSSRGPFTHQGIVQDNNKVSSKGRRIRGNYSRVKNHPVATIKKNRQSGNIGRGNIGHPSRLYSCIQVLLRLSRAAMTMIA